MQDWNPAPGEEAGDVVSGTAAQAGPTVHAARCAAEGRYPKRSCLEELPPAQRAAIEELRRPRTIRERCRRLLALAEQGELRHFRYRKERLDEAAERVAAVVRERYPDLRIPLHSRFRHFEAGGKDRVARLWAKLHGASEAERGRSLVDLVVVSVFLDAGAGAAWRYAEPETGRLFTRSEGLAVASVTAFFQGLFSSDPKHPCRADATGLTAITAERLGEAFQVTPENPLAGLEGRAALLRRLGEELLREDPTGTTDPCRPGLEAADPRQPEMAGGRPGAESDARRSEMATGRPGLEAAEPRRPGELYDRWSRLAGPEKWLRAEVIFGDLLAEFSGIWPGRLQIGGVPLGDVWPHPKAGGSGLSGGLIPFHKLSQWLSYSLVEAMTLLGFQVHGVEALTGLAEYRNGGLLLDLGIIEPRREEILQRDFPASAVEIVEWRALTVAGLDELAPRIRKELGEAGRNLTMAEILEGGTWETGRRIARELRPDGRPPITLKSDGTVF